jgi:hypothetical protein
MVIDDLPPPSAVEPGEFGDHVIRELRDGKAIDVHLALTPVAATR